MIMRHCKLILLVSAFFAIIFHVNGQTQPTSSDSIRVALEQQRSKYPVSQYRAVYKNFMQDFFGPGHILSDTVAAGNYLRYEISNAESFDGPDYEPTGFKGNFYRVNLRKIVDGTIPYDVFFEAFVKSVSDIVPPTPQQWMAIWEEIDNEIKKMGWSFENEDADRNALAQQFSEGNFIAHHSRAYNENVKFHYRIISKEYFEKMLLPYLESADKR